MLWQATQSCSNAGTQDHFSKQRHAVQSHGLCLWWNPDVFHSLTLCPNSPERKSVGLDWGRARIWPGYVSEVDVTPHHPVFLQYLSTCKFSWLLYSASGQVPGFLHADHGSVLPEEFYQGGGEVLQGTLNLWFQTLPGPGQSQEGLMGVSVGVYMFNPNGLTSNFSTCSKVLWISLDS